MVKIEKLIDGASGVFVREGRELPIFLYQLLSLTEYDTLKVTAGKVLVSINEETLVEVTPKQTNVTTEAVVEPVKSVEVVEAVSTPAATTQAKKIVQPAPRKK